jgi:hypothetical protein
MSSDRISAIALCYHYRDSQEAVVYFSNPQHLPVELVTHRLSPIKRPGGYLYPQQWGLASLAPPPDFRLNFMTFLHSIHARSKRKRSPDPSMILSIRCANASQEQKKNTLLSSDNRNIGAMPHG